MQRRLLLQGALALPAAGLLHPAARAADPWPPNKALSIIVPFGPGTALDLNARELAQTLAAQTGASVIVENRPGAGGTIGATAVAKGRTDGASILITDPISLIGNPLLGTPVPFDWRTDLRPLAAMGSVDLYLYTTTKRPFTSFREMVDFAKANPGKLNIGTTGNGGVDHLCAERIKAHAGIDLTVIPYSNVGQVVVALMSGELDLYVLGPLPFLGPIKQGGVRALVSGAPVRSKLLPDVPTLTEAGLPGDLFFRSPFALFAAGGTPDATVQEIVRGLDTALGNAGYQAKIAERGWSFKAETPAGVRRNLDELEVQIRKVVETLKLR
ncbi:MAG: tripartite tricarboxylate transporter substrate binding protein [Rhodoferax sp.]